VAGVVARGAIEQALGAGAALDSFVQFAGEPPTVRAPAADAGADTESVLQELGLSWDDIGQLKAAGVIS